uniref:CHR17 n=1 Tax=Arundo donax TaxID=35708 RepID=A0A0A9FQY6_ARUDO
MEIQVEKIVMHPLKLSTNQEVRNSFSCFQPGQVALVSIWPLLMLWFSMTVIGIHKLICKLKTVHIG